MRKCYLFLLFAFLTSVSPTLVSSAAAAFVHSSIDSNRVAYDSNRVAYKAHTVDSSAILPASSAPPVAAIQPDRTALPGPFDMITNLPGDWYHYLGKTFTWEHAPLIALVAASTAALIVVDRPTWLPVYNVYNKSKPFKSVSDAFVAIGDGQFQFALAGGFAVYGFLAPLIDHRSKSENADRALRTASQTVEVILASGGVIQLLKHITGRESPFVATTRNGAWQFFPNQISYLKHTPHYDAFPSGHLGTAAATLFVIENNYPELTWLKPAGWVVLAGVSTGLVAQGIHWWSDFPLALALGYGFAQLVSPAQDAQHDGLLGANDWASASPLKKLLAKTELFPTVSSGSPGVGLAILF